MATRHRPGSARQALARQRAETRRSAPGKRFVGDAAAQRERARAAEREAVRRMAEQDAAQRRAEALAEPVSAILLELVENSLRLAQTLVTAPFRIALAVWRPRREA